MNRDDRGPLLLILAGVLLLLAVVTYIIGNPGDRPREVAGQRMPALIVVGPKIPLEVRVFVGDAVLVRPFAVPVVRETVGAEIAATVSGDWSLEMIGHSTAEAVGEGGYSPGVFFYALKAGHCPIDMKLVDPEGRAIEGYQASFVVRVIDRE